MRGTLISILVGALAGVLLTLGTNVHASRATATRAAQARAPTIPAQTSADAMSRPTGPSATTAPEAPLPK